jgi:DbpA RNA binding domain
MNINDATLPLNSQNEQLKMLKDKVQAIFANQSLEHQRRLVESIAAELNITVLDCAAALVMILNDENPSNIVPSKISQPRIVAEKPLPHSLATSIRLVRYRLDVGYQHKVTLDEIKIVLVEESGVDIKNIANLRMQDCYTLIDLPDEMPQEIFHHLKTVEINQQKLDIRRVKPRNKKRGNRMHRRPRPVNSSPTKEVSQD